MSCNGCRVLRKGCGDACVLRACLQWIGTAEAQGHATVFVAKFFGRAALLSFISAVPHPQRSALFQSLLSEAVGRTINPVGGAVGLLWSGNWHLCQAAVDTVLRGGAVGPLQYLPVTDSSPHADRRPLSAGPDLFLLAPPTEGGREGGDAIVEPGRSVTTRSSETGSGGSRLANLFA